MKALTALLIISAALLAGCIDVNVEQVIFEDRNSEVSITYNLSNMMQGASNMQGMFGEEELLTETNQQEDLCADFEDEDYVCEQLGEYTVKISTDMHVDERYLNIQESFTQTQYLLDARIVYEILEEIEMEGFDAASLRQADAEFIYVVRMPAPITDFASAQKISEDTAQIDVLMMSRNTPEIIVSTQKHTLRAALLYGGSSMILLIVLIVVIQRVIKQKREQEILSAAPDATQLSTQERRHKQYIQQYSKQYPRESINQTLLQAGLSQQQADQYLDKYYRKT